MKPKRIDGKWGYDFSFHGKRYRKQGIPTKKMAEAMINNIVNDVTSGLLVNDSTLLHEYFENWLEVNKRHILSEASFKRNLNSLNKVIEYFGEEMRLKDVNRTNYQEFINHFAEKLSKESMDKIHQPLKSSFEDAVYNGYITKNPAYKANVYGKVPPKPKELKYLPLTAYVKLKRMFMNENTKSGNLLFILHITGARFSEVNHMLFDHIDIDNGRIYLDGTKTDNSKRWISIPTVDMEHIVEYIKTNDIRSGQFLFNISHRAASKTYDKLKTSLGIKQNITMHALRHTHCSFLYNNDVSIYYISRRLGHANIKITLEYYSHLFEEKYTYDDSKALQIISENRMINN